MISPYVGMDEESDPSDEDDAAAEMQPRDEMFGGWKPPAAFEGGAAGVTVPDVLRRAEEKMSDLGDNDVSRRCRQIHAKVDEVLDLARAIAQPQRELDALRDSFSHEFGLRAPNIFADAAWCNSGRTPADALAANAAQQSALAARQAQLKENMERMIAALGAEGARLRERETEIRSYAALSPLRLNDVPTILLRRAVGLGGIEHVNLLRHASRCAKVCSEWRLLALGETAYGHGLPPSERAQVLRDITLQLTASTDGPTIVGPTVAPFALDELGWGADPRRPERILDHVSGLPYADLQSTDADLQVTDDNNGATGVTRAGAETRWRIMAAVLQALPVPIRIRTMNLSCCGLTAAVAPLLASALARGCAPRTPSAAEEEQYRAGFMETDPGVDESVKKWKMNSLRILLLGGNQQLSEGMTVLAPALPLGLRRLAVNDIGLGDAGMAALAAVFPSMEYLNEIDCGYSPAVTKAGWAVAICIEIHEFCFEI